jgi:hypothetical protein
MFAIAAFLALALTQLVAAQYPPQGPYLQVRSLGNICVTMLKETRPSVGVKGETHAGVLCRADLILAF